ncbi:hypothetical protein [Alteriqipengyuania lutimaris]|uniref:Uncharacterized protein n=1 Tax=Alteriqipengyuania lutimaris TaxID=1538146 RepID=A0A395LNW4_9SPHN|nr:hypothetical protein [Alteriqipengyuania lutimaris]MBB3032507.1 hypothetical protein [Alteriqipengyuania lutimaris]RDS78359.1 hypothetical protein DL238_12605 [Alteriqipengyuania lutimaris]
MDLPTHPHAGMRLALSETLTTAGVTRVCTIGHPDPQTREVLAQFAGWGGELDILECACNATVFPPASGACAWIMPPVTNYYHAYRLLHGIRAICTKQEMPLLVVRPQLESAIARRDYYPGIPQVPPAWRHCSESCVMHGEASERATVKGGLRNGVLTAIEDFTQELWDEGTALAYTCLPAIGGFCALFDVEADWSPKLAHNLSRFHDGAAVAAMSERELREYLAIIERSRPNPSTRPDAAPQ